MNVTGLYHRKLNENLSVTYTGVWAGICAEEEDGLNMQDLENMRE